MYQGWMMFFDVPFSSNPCLLCILNNNNNNSSSSSSNSSSSTVVAAPTRIPLSLSLSFPTKGGLRGPSSSSSRSSSAFRSPALGFSSPSLLPTELPNTYRQPIAAAAAAAAAASAASAASAAAAAAAANSWAGGAWPGWCGCYACCCFRECLLLLLFLIVDVGICMTVGLRQRLAASGSNLHPWR